MIRSILTTTLLLVYLTVTAQLNREEVLVILDKQSLYTIQIEDLDGDGDQDIIGSIDGYNGTFVTFFNLDGQGNYGPPVTFGDTTWWGNDYIELNFDLGDMDNDGDMDLIPRNFIEGSIPYYSNDGSGNFSHPDVNTINDLPPFSVHYVQVADLDNDGFQDIVIYNQGTNELFYNRRVDGGAFFEKTLLHEPNINPNGYSNIYDFLLLDYDLDGDLDYALLAVESSTVSGNDRLALLLYEQTCDLCFEAPLRLPIDEDGHSFDIYGDNLKTADLNGDSYPDFLIRYEIDDGIYDQSVLRILGNPNSSGNIENEIMNVSSLAITDFDQDGADDLFLAITPTSGDMYEEVYYWYENDWDYSFQEHLISELYTGEYVFSADINSDGIPDLLSFQRDLSSSANSLVSSPIGVRAGQVDQSFSNYRPLNLPLERMEKVTSEDWDGDGDMDLLFFGHVLSNFVNIDGIYRITNEGNGNYSHPFRVHSADISSAYSDFVDINLDGRLDAITIEAENSGNKLSYTLQQADGSWSASVEIIPEQPFYFRAYTADDWDNDGDPDVLYNGNEGELFLAINNMNTEGSFSTSLLDISFTHMNTVQLSGDDFNQDGTADILLLQDQKLLYARSLSSEPEYDAWDTIPLQEDIIIQKYHVADFTADGYQDILVLGGNSSSYYSALAVFNAEENRFSAFKPISRTISNQIGISSSPPVPADLNNDGAMDLISKDGFRINLGNGSLFSAGYIPPPLEYYLDFPFFINAIQVDIDGDEQMEIVSGHRMLLGYDYDFLNRSMLSGTVRWDTAATCQTDSLSYPLNDWLLAVNGPTFNQLASTNNAGQYGALLPEMGEYRVEVLPPSGYWAACPPDTLLTVLDSTSTFTVDFAAEALVDCPLVVIDMSSTSISQCFNSTVSIGYHNAGTAMAEDAVITLAFDPRLDPINSTPAWTSRTETTLIYEFAGINVGERGFISVNFEPDCENLPLDEELCFEATITPNDLCEDMLADWDGANLEAEVLCEEDDLSYRIINTGEGAMAAAETYLVSIVNDDIILYLSGEVILEPGQADTIPLPASDDAWYLRVGQTAGHPYPVPVGLVATNCETADNDEITNLLPNGTGNPFVANLCRTVIGPYDPNDKTAIPIGMGEEHDIERTWPIDYTIQFQNVGSDRARTVILHDQLSELLDLSTFEPKAASHEYEWHILDDRLLIVTFPDINLPDSTSNEAASQGFFSFRIQPRSDAPFDTVIENNADIYFDFNPPIRTGTVLHTIRKPVIGNATRSSVCPGDSYLGVTIDQDTILEYRYEFAEYDSIHWHHLSVYPPQMTEVVVSLSEAGWWEGIYIAQDTTITAVLPDVMGCDSTIVYQLQLLTNTEQLALEQAIKLQPNPAQDASWLSWSGLSAPDIILVYNQLGQQVGEYYPATNSEQFRLLTNNLPSGSYRIRLHWKDKQANKILQLVR